MPTTWHPASAMNAVVVQLSDFLHYDWANKILSAALYIFSLFSLASPYVSFHHSHPQYLNPFDVSGRDGVSCSRDRLELHSWKSLRTFSYVAEM